MGGSRWAGAKSSPFSAERSRGPAGTQRSGNGEVFAVAGRGGEPGVLNGRMAANPERRRARKEGKMEREGLARGESEVKALAVAGRGAGELCEAGRGDCARSA